jgi:hypothetical protein
VLWAGLGHLPLQALHLLSLVCLLLLQPLVLLLVSEAAKAPLGLVPLPPEGWVLVLVVLALLVALALAAISPVPSER